MTIFSTSSSANAYAINANAVHEMHLVDNTNVQLTDTRNFSCLQKYFVNASLQTKMLPSLSEYHETTESRAHLKAINALLNVLERVDPEFLLVCLMVLVPLVFIALPLLAMLLLYALRLHKDVHTILKPP